MNKKREIKQVYYIGFYSEENNSQIRRYSVPAATNKMDYIAKVFARLDCDINIISPSWVTSKTLKTRYYPSHKNLNRDGISVVYSPSFSAKNKALLAFSKLFSLFWLFFFLTKNTKQETIVTVYHSTLFCFPVLLAKRIRHFKLILEVEEIYYAFTKSNKKQEVLMFYLADSYLFSNKRITNFLLRTIDKQKPFVVINGEYQIKKELTIKKKTNKFINVVFAGNIEKVRKGAFNAVSCAKFLSDKYILHIIGFGKDNDIKKLVAEIEKTNKFFGYQKCKYLGVKYNNDYSQFLYNCDIGINPQETNETYMQFAFPSKIISYLSHNLRVVSTELEAIQNSEFADLITMVPNPTPRSFANAIMNIDVNVSFNSIERIKKADSDFINNLKQTIFYSDK